MANRLKLDFTLDTNEERTLFLNQYLTEDTFQKKAPTDDELEMMGNYLLWGKDPESGKNAVQDKDVQIQTRGRTWDRDEVDSLDALMESPTFNEAQLSYAASAPTKKVREVFNRTDALARCPSHLTEEFRSLFAQIDRLDLSICYYELNRGKRKNPPRDKLLNKFNIEEQLIIEHSAIKWNQHKYLKNRHLLVELRRQQFTLRDSFTPLVLQHSTPLVSTDPEFDFESDVCVLPLGLVNEKTKDLVFKERKDLNPSTYNKKMLSALSTYYWDLEKTEVLPNTLVIDFRDLETVYQLFNQFFETLADVKQSEKLSGIQNLLDTLMYYVELADLIPIHRDLLDMKMRKLRNQDIAEALNKEYGKAYTPNYISTVFRHKIIPKINEAAEAHLQIVGVMFFPEEFKKCNTCGVTYLRNTDNFMRKGRSPDGFANRCKCCDRIDRQINKRR